MNQEMTTTTSDQQVAIFEQAQGLLEQIPDVSDDPTPRMAAAILAADDPTDWARAFQAKSIKASAGHKFRINAVRKAPSSFKGPLESYLVAEVVDLATGEADILSISSVMSVLQLVVAHDRGWLPLDVEIVQKDRPTRNGFYPIHLRALEAPKQVDAKA